MRTPRERAGAALTKSCLANQKRGSAEHHHGHLVCLAERVATLIIAWIPRATPRRARNENRGLATRCTTAMPRDLENW